MMLAHKIQPLANLLFRPTGTLLKVITSATKSQ